MEKSSKKKVGWLSTLLAIIMFLFAFYFWGGKEFLSPENENSYQAVFLGNGQVYFGKLGSQYHYFVLKDVYYLEAGSLDAAGSVSGGQQKIGLVKLGAELHGPEDEMFISKDQVLFWENMSDDSRVLKAIKDHKESSI